MDIDYKVFEIYKALLEKQYVDRDINQYIPNTPVIGRNDLRNLPKLAVDRSFGYSKSSGSTGEPLVLEKTFGQYLFHRATNLIELAWRKWDMSKNIAVISPHIHDIESYDTVENKYMFQSLGKTYTHPVYGDLQDWIDDVPADYLVCLPSLIKTLDTSKFIDVKSGSEQGGTMYSSAEVGTIAIECPDNKDVYHVMDNIIVEIDEDSNIIITDLLHPYIKRYMIGDKGEFAKCSCGRKSQVLNKNVLGRKRNFAVDAAGKRFWPLFGTIAYCDRVPNLKKFQAVQDSPTNIVFNAQGELTEKDFEEIYKILNETMGSDYNFAIQLVDSFPPGKHEEFICLV